MWWVNKNNNPNIITKQKNTMSYPKNKNKKIRQIGLIFFYFVTIETIDFLILPIIHIHNVMLKSYKIWHNNFKLKSK